MMQIGNFKFFNDLHNIVQLPDAHKSNSTYTNVRKRVLDSFHTELKNRCENDQSKDSPKNGVILTSAFYPFNETSSGKLLKYEEQFSQFEGQKFRVSEYMVEIDLQLFANIPWDILCYKRNYELLSHPNIPPDTKTIFYDRYEKDRGTRYSNFFGPILNTYSQGKIPQEIVIAPVNAFEHIRASGILEQNRELLDKAQHNYIPWLPSIDDSYMITEKAIEELDRPFDCFLSGIEIPFVYPYRYLAFREVQKLKGKIKILCENRMGFMGIYKETNASFKKEHITKKQLDLRADLLAQMQYEEYMERASLSKVAVVCSSVFGYPLKKYFEFMARGCVLVGDMPKYYKEYGFKHMENMVRCDVEDIQDAVMYVTSNEDLRIKLAKNALKLLKDRYTPKHQVDNLMRHLTDISKKYNTDPK